MKKKNVVLSTYNCSVNIKIHYVQYLTVSTKRKKTSDSKRDSDFYQNLHSTVVIKHNCVSALGIRSFSSLITLRRSNSCRISRAFSLDFSINWRRNLKRL